MPVTTNIDGLPGTVMMEPFWQIQRAFVLAWFEVALASYGSPGDGYDFLEYDLTVQLWTRRKPTDSFDYVAEVILPAGDNRKITEQQKVGYGYTIPVVLAPGSQNAVVHNGGEFWPSFAPPTITVTPHGTWA